MVKSYYKTQKGKIIHISDKEFNEMPFNSKLMKLNENEVPNDELKPKKKGKTKGDD